MVKVIGLCGSIGAGKDVVSKYLVKNYGYVQLTIGDIVREEMTEKKIEITRENSDHYSEEMRKKYGQDYFVKRCIEKIKKEKYTHAIIDGVRLPSDSELILKAFKKDYVMFEVNADPFLRYERLQIRGRSDLPHTLEEFDKQERMQNDIFHLDETFKKASEVIDNGGTMEELYENVREIAKNPKYKNWF
ncbi:Dephospho-CoA kinase [Candidatus Tiddalikarchaeum anstoanum]|nr:Dephospho-CoA kinase [Candidatus Tiddalikarchaeum anstoanum]